MYCVAIENCVRAFFCECHLKKKTHKKQQRIPISLHREKKTLTMYKEMMRHTPHTSFCWSSLFKRARASITSTSITLFSIFLFYFNHLIFTQYDRQFLLLFDLFLLPRSLIWLFCILRDSVDFLAYIWLSI